MKRFGLFLMTASLVGAAAPQTFTGVVTDTMCGADHKAMQVSPDERCVRECVRAGGGSYRYALLHGKSVLVLSDQKAAEAFAAKHVRVTGVIDEKTKTIEVTKIEPAHPH